MKFLILLFAISLPILFTSKVNAQGPNPGLTYSQSKKIIYLGKDSDKNNSITLKANFQPEKGEQLSSIEWELTGIKDKDWCVVEKYDNGKPKCGGNINQEEIEILFKKVGNYSFTLTAIYTYKEDGEDEEDEVSIEAESILTVTQNFDDLTQLYAENNFEKLVRKASSYQVKPELKNDPSPYIFLAKGYYGKEKNQIVDPIVEDLLAATTDCLIAAMELDINGIFYTSIHKRWLNEFQNYWINEEIIGNLDEDDGYYSPYSGSDKEKKQERNDASIEGCEVYASISKYPITSKLLEAALRYDAKDTKTANSIWNSAIPKLSELNENDFDKMTRTDLQILKYGALLSATTLTEITESNSKACTILKSLEKFYEKDKTFTDFIERQYNNCTVE